MDEHVSGNKAWLADKKAEARALTKHEMLDDAKHVYEDLISAKVQDFEVFYNLAIICGIRGLFEAQFGYLKKCLELDPLNILVHQSLGLCSHKQGCLEAAIESYTKAIDIRPDSAELYYQLGNVHLELGRAEEAVACLKKALSINPEFVAAHNNLGMALKSIGELDEAIGCYSTAIRINSDYFLAHYNLGIARVEARDLDGAICSFQDCLKIDKRHIPALLDLGTAYREIGKSDLAITCYKDIIQLEPSLAEAHCYLGHTLCDQGNYSDAILSYRRALDINPYLLSAHNGMGMCLIEEDQLDDAKYCFSKAIDLHPDCPETHFYLAWLILLQGDYKSGLDHYEWRNKRDMCAATTIAKPKCMQLDSDLEGLQKNILLVSEQGIGDTIQFMRYAKSIRELGYNVRVCTDRKLHSLIIESGIDSKPLTPEEGNNVSSGCWMPLMSVMRLLEISPVKPLIDKPYIHVPSQYIEKWRFILKEDSRPLVGLNWQGNPKSEGPLQYGRSLPLESFSPIADLNHLSLLSLQKGFGSEQLAKCTFRNRFKTNQSQVNEAWDFMDTAAIICNCDLIITSDTYVAHLAGGLGKATWLLLKKIPEWRWGLENETTFWYPTLRLFRQSRHGDWDEVVQRVTSELLTMFPETMTI